MSEHSDLDWLTEWPQHVPHSNLSLISLIRPNIVDQQNALLELNLENFRKSIFEIQRLEDQISLPKS